MRRPGGVGCCGRTADGCRGGFCAARAGCRAPAAVDYLEALALRRAAPTATVGETLDPRRPLFARLWEPLAVAALNTGVEEASALLFWQILGQTLGRGGAACRPLVPRDGLSETFVDPALETLRRHDARLHFGARLRAIDFAGNRAAALAFDTGSVELGGDDDVILATPAAMAARLVPGLVVPDLYSPIVNAHFRCTPPPESPLFVGVIGGAAQWIFRKREVLSVTVSAAQPIVERPAEELSESLWRDVAAAYRSRSHRSRRRASSRSAGRRFSPAPSNCCGGPRRRRSGAI